MKFSKVDVLYKEKWLLANRKGAESMTMIGRLFNSIINPRNPKYTFCFYVPQYLYIRSAAFCDIIAEKTEKHFDIGDLARVLFEDFLEYYKRKNDIHLMYKQLMARNLSPASVKYYNTDQAHPGVLFEEVRGFEIVETRLEHKAALLGEFILRDMLEIYQDHNFTLEAILEIVFCNFIDDYRKTLIKNPVGKIAQYVV